MRIARNLRSWSKVGAVSALLVAGLWVTAGEVEASRSARSRSAQPTARSAGHSSTRHAVPRAAAPSRTPSTRHARGPAYSYRGHGGRHYGGHHVGVRIGFGYGYPYYPYWGYYAPHYWYYWPYHPYAWGRPYHAAYAGGLGGFDLNVKPKKAAVYVDGDYVGTAGKFDGYPGYLWLDRGRHELVFHLPGFQTVAREVTAVAGTVIDLRVQLEEGPTQPPEAVMSGRYERRVAVEGRPPERSRPAPPARLPPPADLEPPEAPEAPESAAELDLRGEPGRFRVRVEPLDASLYLDGRFLGTASELGRLHSGLIVDPGDHQLEVVRPGYRSETLDFVVEAGEEVTLEVELEPS